MPMELADEINQVSNVDVFIHNFVDVDSMSLANLSSIQHPASRKRKRSIKHFIFQIEINQKYGTGMDGESK